MKKRTIKSTLALMLAMAMVLGGAMNVHAAELADDGCAKHENQDGDRESGHLGGGSSSSGGGSSDSGSSGSSYNDSGSSDNGSSSDSGDSGSYDYSSSYDSGSSSDGGACEAADSSYAAPADGTGSAPTGLTRKGNTVNIPGYETFRQINKAADGRVSIYHCGIEQYTAQLKDADSKAVAFKSAGMYKDEATGKWYLNITTDTEGCTVGTYKGSVNYITKLGMSGVMVNEKLIVEATAE